MTQIRQPEWRSFARSGFAFVAATIGVCHNPPAFLCDRLAAAEPRRVLLFHSFGPQVAPWVFVASHFRQQLFTLSKEKIDLLEARSKARDFERSASWSIIFRPFSDHESLT